MRVLIASPSPDVAMAVGLQLSESKHVVRFALSLESAEAAFQPNFDAVV